MERRGDAFIQRSFASRTLSRASTGALFRAAGWAGGYAAWTICLRLLIVTFVTYFVTSSASGGAHPTRFEDVSEALGANELSFLGFSAFAFVFLVKLANPMASSSTRDGFRAFFTPERLEKRFLPGFFHGALVGWGLILAFLISGIFRYLGFAMQPDEVPLALPGIAVRTLAVAALAYSEEYIFRQKIAYHLRAFHAGLRAPAFSLLSSRLGHALTDRFSRHSDAFAAIATAILYCLIKELQLDAQLGWMHLTTLFLLSIALSLRTLKDGDFARGAGFWAALLVVFHPLLSLPVLGNEFSGLLLVKYVGVSSENLDPTTRFFTGGVGGPLSSFAFQVLLILDIVQGILRYKKTSPLKPVT